MMYVSRFTRATESRYAGLRANSAGSSAWRSALWNQPSAVASATVSTSSSQYDRMPYTHAAFANVARACLSTAARYAASGKQCGAAGGTTYSSGDRNSCWTTYAASSSRGLLRDVFVECARHLARNTI